MTQGRIAPRTVLGVAALGVFMAFVDATIVNIAFPDIQRSFTDTDITALQWVLNAYNIVFAAFLIAAGKLADLLGRRRVFIVGLAIFTFASAVCAIAPSVETLVAARVLQAIGAALLVPASLALVVQAFGAEHRAHGVALWTAVAALAAGIGPTLGGLLVSAESWRLAFLVNVPIGIAAIVFSRRHLVESRAPGRRRVPDLLGSAVLAAAIAALVLAIVQGPEWGWTDARTLVGFGIAFALSAVVIRRSVTHKVPILDPKLLRIRSVAVANTITVIASLGFFGYTLVNVLFLTSVWGYSILDAGLAMTPGPFVAAAVAGPASRVAERYGTRAVIVPGGIVWGTALVWFATQVGPTPAFVAEWLPGIVLGGIGAGLAFPNVSGAAVAGAPGEDFATSSGINSVARQVGAAIGVAAMVAVLGQPQTPQETLAAYDDAWTLAAVCLYAMGLGALALGRVAPGAAGDLPSLAASARFGLAAAAPAAPKERRARPPRTIAPPVALNGSRAETAADFLARAPIFAGLPADQRELLAESATPVRVEAGGWLFREGEEADGLYVVRAGLVEVIAEESGAVLRRYGRGSVIGELALLTDQPRSASVRAARASDLLLITQAAFEQALERAPQLSRAISRNLAEQLRVSRVSADRTRPRPVTIALVPLTRDIPVARIAEALAGALSAGSRVARLDRSDAPDLEGGEPLAVWGPAVDAVEHRHDHLIMTAGIPGQDEPWTGFCLQQADRVLALAGPGVDTALAERPDLAGADLVAVDVAPGSGALNAAADAIAPQTTHVLRTGDAFSDDIDRIARRLCGRAVSLVLAGGGARAFAHLGVIAELVEAGVRIDRVAGTSMGAWIAGMVALGMSPEEMDARTFDEWVRRRPLADYTMPRHALIRGERVRMAMRRTFGDVSIEESAIGLITVSADLMRHTEVVHRHGRMQDAVGPSLALPVLGPPQIHGQQMLVDGAVVNNLPISHVADLNEGRIIAVDIRGSGEPGPSSSDGRPRELRAPPLGETLMRVLFFASADTRAASRHADLVILPRAAGVGFLEFHQIDRAIESGREAAAAALAGAPDELFA